MKNYFVYLPGTTGQKPWECTATSTGYARSLPGVPYPPDRHPVDHHFTWSDGRALHAYQFVYITSGSGQFQSERSELTRVAGGDLIILFPGIWHRYSPDPGTGWSEHWIECQGPAFHRARKQGVLLPDRPIQRFGLVPDLLIAFGRCHDIARTPWPNNQSLLSTMGLHILSIVHCGIGSTPQTKQWIDEIVRAAQTKIMQRYHERLSMRELARELGVGYSYFRHGFKALTGISPKQYQLHLRLRKSQELLLNTSKTISEVADILGFDSACHFSTQFRKHIGHAPSGWRKQNLSRPGLLTNP
jgi:AraC-like DNA-binding protein